MINNTKLGRSVAQAQGIDPNTVDLTKFGDAVFLAMRKSNAPPSATHFFLPPPAPPPAPVNLDKLTGNLVKAATMAHERAAYQQTHPIPTRKPIVSYSKATVKQNVRVSKPVAKTKTSIPKGEIKYGIYILFLVTFVNPLITISILTALLVIHLITKKVNHRV